MIQSKAWLRNQPRSPKFNPHRKSMGFEQSNYRSETCVKLVNTHRNHLLEVISSSECRISLLFCVTAVKRSFLCRRRSAGVPAYIHLLLCQKCDQQKTNISEHQCTRLHRPTTTSVPVSVCCSAHDCDEAEHGASR